jgi:hypothetical protein
MLLKNLQATEVGVVMWHLVAQSHLQRQRTKAARDTNNVNQDRVIISNIG